MNSRRIAAFLLTLLACLLFTAAPLLAEMVSIKGDKVNMRSGPSTSKKVLWVLGKGYPLKVISRKGNWLKVEDFEGDRGWVHRKVTSKTRYMIVKANRGTKKRINVRSGPGTKYKVVARAYYGVVFRNMGVKNGWVKVRHDSGVTGWIKRTLLWGF